jgi:LSU ribosomal protein L20P
MSGRLPRILGKKVSNMPTVTEREKKSLFRALWIQRINAAVRTEGLSYSQFMGKLKASNIEINRKVLADLALNNPTAFSAIVSKVK